jgi:hypothetical protein
MENFDHCIIKLVEVSIRKSTFSGFWIGWMIEHPTKSKSKNPKKVRCSIHVKSKKSKSFWIFVRLFDWIGIF